jgi:expansin (peptidoglycan-binding protein)
MRLKAIAKASFIGAAIVQLASASIIVQSSGNSMASVPLGYYGPYGTATVYAVSWTQDSAYTNVDVSANLFNAGGGGTVDYTLTTAIGPSTSFALDGIISGSVTTPANPTDVDLFQLPALGAGTYYLVLDSPTAGSAWQYNFPFLPSYTTGPGVSFLGDQQAQFAAINNSYTAGSSFSPIGYPVEFEVTGSLAAPVPEPNFFGGIGLALLGVAIALRKHACASRYGKH